MIVIWARADQQAAGAAKLEAVRGRACYTYGDNETPAQARKAALALAQEQAVRSYRTFVQSSIRVKNLELEEDLIESASAAVLRDLQVESEERKEQQICTAIQARINPAEVDALIEQKIQAKQISEAAKTQFLGAISDFSLKVWTNHPSGMPCEGEALVVYVESERDAYLKLDFFQADGTVMHLAPNPFRREVFLRAGRTYSFGGAEDAERFTVSGPFGDETIKAIASTKPLDTSLVPTRQSEGAAPYMTKLRGQLRAVRVEPGAAAGSRGEWAESLVRLTTISRAAADLRGAVGRAPRVPAKR